MIDDEVITYEEAINHPEKNIINKCIGCSDKCELNIYSSSVGLINNDIIFLCSDGITDVIDDNTLKAVFDKQKSIKETLEEIHSLSLKNGSKDNISLIIVKSTQKS